METWSFSPLLSASLALLRTHLLQVSIITAKQLFRSCGSVKVTKSGGLIYSAVVLNVSHETAALVKQRRESTLFWGQPLSSGTNSMAGTGNVGRGVRRS